MNISIDQELNNEFDRLEYRINELEFKVDFINFDLMDIVNVQLLGDSTIYYAIGDIFVSYTGKHYMKVFLHGQFVEIHIKNISIVFDYDSNKPSNIVKNWYKILDNIDRGKKIKRLIGDEI